MRAQLPRNRATEPESESSASDEPKRAKGVQKRLDELTRQREEAERRAQETAARLDKALSMLEKITGNNDDQLEQAAQITQAGNAEPVRPNKARYDDPDQYEQATGRGKGTRRAPRTRPHLWDPWVGFRLL